MHEQNRQGEGAAVRRDGLLNMEAVYLMRTLFGRWKVERARQPGYRAPTSL